jgi:4-alpha-glucanotransferase
MRLPVLDRRRAGVVLHLGSLENPLGRGGRAFIDWLAEAGFSVWQVLPLGPTGPDGSPYWVRSDFAGNPAFLDAAELPPAGAAEYAAFVAETEEWLEDYALFEVLSGAHSGAVWWTWPADVRDRVGSALDRVAHDLAAELERTKREQFAFFVQWRRLREHAHRRGVRILGDLPFYVAPHSAETWAHRDQFQLDAAGRPAAVAGVPPDYFSQTGQLWGNPLYDWQAMRRDNFAYWRARVLAQLERVDLLRIDHFRALAAHWAVPAGAPDARGGEWRLTPGEDLLRLLMEELGDLPILAEDLGVITDDVVALRKGFGLPGMRVLQFAFSGEGDNPHLPHMHEHDSVVYTGTHDNDTTLGWYRSLTEEVRRSVDFTLRAARGSMPEALIREALGSVGQLAIIPAQDVLALGSEARLNTPGTVEANWRWRLPAGALTPELGRHFARLNGIYGRL